MTHKKVALITAGGSGMGADAVRRLASVVSSLIAYLASDGAAYITGQNIRIDGGLTRAV